MAVNLLDIVRNARQPADLLGVVRNARVRGSGLARGREFRATPEGIAAALRRIPPAIREDYQAAAEGDPDVILTPLQALGVALSPLTGTARALVGEPVKRAAQDAGLGPSASKKLGVAAEQAALLAIPLKAPRFFKREPPPTPEPLALPSPITMGHAPIAGGPEPFVLKDIARKARAAETAAPAALPVYSRERLADVVLGIAEKSNLRSLELERLAKKINEKPGYVPTEKDYEELVGIREAMKTGDIDLALKILRDGPQPKRPPPAGTTLGMLGTGPEMANALINIVKSARRSPGAVLAGTAGAAGGFASTEEEDPPGEQILRTVLGTGAGILGAKAIGRLRRGPDAVPVTRLPPVIPGAPAARTRPLPVNPDVLSIPGELGLAYHQALNPEVFRRAGTAGVEFFRQNPGMYDRTLSVTENIGRNIGRNAGKGIDADFLKQFGLQDQEVKFVTHAYESMRQSAQSMAQMSRVSRELNLSAEQREVLRAAGVETEDAAQMLPWWRRADNITRGAIVSQLGTAVRNAETVVARLGLDTMTSVLDAGIARLAGKRPQVGALDGMETFLNTISAVRPSRFKSQKAVTGEVMKAFPSATHRLLSTFNADLSATQAGGKAAGLGERALQGAESLVHMANVFNRGQEFLIRRAVFSTKLAQEVARTGRKLEDIIKSGEAWRIPEEAVRKSVERALEVTFGATPKFGTVGRAFTDFIAKTQPISTLAIPFPRFLVQAWKFQAEYSPMGFLRYLSPSQRAQLAKGDMSGAAKAIIGSGLFGAAVAMRESPNAGARWYNYETDEGKIVDLRPFAPFSTYLFMAELLATATGKRQGVLTTKDISDGLLGVNLRAGTGLVLLDQVLEGAVNTAKQGDIPKLLKQMAGEYVGRLTVPFAQLRDAYDEFVDGFSIAREKAPEGREFIGPIIASVPIASRTLPPVVSPVQAGPYVTERPFTLKQLTGIRRTPAKNPGAAELDRLGFRGPAILPRTGIKSVDRKYAAIMGPLVEEKLSALVRLPLYARQSDEFKGTLVQQALNDLRAEMRARVRLTEEERVKLRMGRLPRRMSSLISSEAR